VKFERIFIAFALVMAWLFYQPVMADAQLNEQEVAFLKRHWPDSIPLQGTVPVTHSKLDASLQPESCGTCHAQQYRDWQTTLHAKAMGPGLLGQLVEMVGNDPDSARMCWSCHTPLAEQQDKLLTSEGWRKNPAFDKQLQHQGLVCAGCHVRKHQRFGPTRKGQPKQIGKVSGALPHNGFSAETAFGKSAFCKGCHQFGDDDYALNGKLIENTYNEWLASDYPAKGMQCQTCHMPDRRHLWRGIHDPNMVKQGVTIKVDTDQMQYGQGGRLNAKIKITNSGAGHYFPTYLTPKIEVQAYLVDAEGNIDQSTLQQAMIGREVTLDISQELYDTRIPPGETLAIAYSHPINADNMQLHVEVTVYPDHFYTRFYESMLSNGSAGRGTQLIKQALKESQASSFTLFEKTIPLSANSKAVAIKELKPSPISANPAATHDQRPDWNAEQIQWFDYEQGLQIAKQSGKAVMLIFYADWCPTCHAYKQIFVDPRVVEQAKGLVMVRANVDQSAQLASRYNDDGEYVPRIYGLNKNGEQITALFEQRNYPKHFVPADATHSFLALMRQIQR
jgi:thiol-disulfide isomerase/thioredoxin